MDETLANPDDPAIASSNTARAPVDTIEKNLPIPAEVSKRHPNSTALDKIYKQALKEFHRLKSPVTPNLGAKRPFATQKHCDNKTQNNDPVSEWMSPRKTFKNAQQCQQM